MFYEESIISKFLICKICECKLSDPRVLPCGNSICNNCIDFLINSGENHMKCRFCGKTHQVPSDGFPSNNELAELVKVKPNEVSRNKLTADFKLILSKLNEKINQIETE